jgi:hypothetical protein
MFQGGRTGLGGGGCRCLYDSKGLVLDSVTKGLPVGDDIDCRVGL